jgi:hypothetical protein
MMAAGNTGLEAQKRRLAVGNIDSSVVAESSAVTKKPRATLPGREIQLGLRWVF